MCRGRGGSHAAFFIEELIAERERGRDELKERGQGLAQPAKVGSGGAGECCRETPGAQRIRSPESVVVPVGTAVDFFSSLGVGVEKAACHKAPGLGTG